MRFINSFSHFTVTFFAFISLTSCGDVSNKSGRAINHFTNYQVDKQAAEKWFKSGSDAIALSVERSKNINNTRGAARNVILFVGDGMSISTITAARILAGQNEGFAGEEYQLSFEKFPFSGLAKTYNTNQQTPDSAGTMTAIITGVKTKAGVIGVDENIVRGDCKSINGTKLTSALELAEIAGKATGIVSTTRVTHATPAATYAKSPERNWEDISVLPTEAVTAGCKDIADQLVHFESLLKTRFDNVEKTSKVDGIDVIMGGGRRSFLRNIASDNSEDTDESVEGKRTDNRNLIKEWKVLYPKGDYIIDRAGFDSIKPNTDKLLGLFDSSHMHYEADRSKDKLGEPSLTEMTKKAISILKKDEDGFFLMVEAGRIDHAHHAGSAYNALTEAIELSKAVQAAVDATNDKETLIIVTADHGHVFTIGGYPTRGNHILGKVVENDKMGNPQSQYSLADDGLPFTTLSYRNGRGFKNLGDETNADVTYERSIRAGRVNLSNIDTTQSGFHQESFVASYSESHSGEDVGVFARGPGAHLVSGTHEQNIIFHVIDYAANLTRKDKSVTQKSVAKDNI